MNKDVDSVVAVFIVLISLTMVFLAGHVIGHNSPIQFLAWPPRAVESRPSTGLALTSGEEYLVKRIKVMQGHIFDIEREDGRRYLVHLENITGTPPEAKPAVLKLLNEHQRKKHQLIMEARSWDSKKERWAVRIYYDVSIDSRIKPSSLGEWLVLQGLVYNR